MDFDVIVIGAGVIGSSVAYHLARLGCRNVLVLERNQIGSGTTSQSSGILRTHYSVPENVQLAQASWNIFDDFSAYLQDEEASAGLVKCGYLIAAPEGSMLAPLAAALKSQNARGIEVAVLDRQQARVLLPIASFDDSALIGFEPQAGFADAYLVTSSFARAARRLGVKFLEGVEVQALAKDGDRGERCPDVARNISRPDADQHPEHLGARHRALDRDPDTGDPRTPCSPGARGA